MVFVLMVCEGLLKRVINLFHWPDKWQVFFFLFKTDTYMVYLVPALEMIKAYMCMFSTAVFRL